MRFEVSGKSMEPTYMNGDKLFVKKSYKNPKTGDVVVVKDPRSEMLLLKRIESVKGKDIFVRGDSPQWSTDSRTFGAITKKAIVGLSLFAIIF